MKKCFTKLTNDLRKHDNFDEIKIHRIVCQFDYQQKSENL